MKVRESAQDPSDPVFVFFAGAHLGKARVMEEEVGGIEFIKDGKMALIPDLLNETANERLVVAIQPETMAVRWRAGAMVRW